MAGTSDRVAERLIARYYYKLNCIHRPSCVSQIYRLHAVYLIQCHLYSRLNWRPFIFSTSLTCIISPWQRPHNKPLNPPVLVQLPVLGVSTWIGESTCIDESTCIGCIYLDWRRAQSKDLVPGSLRVSIHVDEDVNSVLVNHVGRLPIARHLQHQPYRHNTHYRPHPSSPVIIVVAQPKIWYPFYCHTDSGRLSRLRFCRKVWRPYQNHVTCLW